MDANSQFPKLIGLDDCADDTAFTKCYRCVQLFLASGEGSQNNVSRVIAAYDLFMKTVQRFIINQDIMRFLERHSGPNDIQTRILVYLRESFDQMCFQLPSQAQRSMAQLMEIRKGVPLASSVSRVQINPLQALKLRQQQQQRKIGTRSQPLASMFSSQVDMLFKFEMDNKNASTKLRELKRDLRDMKRYADDFLPDIELEIDPQAKSIFIQTDLQKQERIMELQQKILRLQDKRVELLQVTLRTDVKIDAYKMLRFRTEVAKLRYRMAKSKFKQVKKRFVAFKANAIPNLDLYKENIKRIPKGVIDYIMTFDKTDLTMSKFPRDKKIKEALNDMIEDNIEVEDDSQSYFRRLFAITQQTLFSAKTIQEILDEVFGAKAFTVSKFGKEKWRNVSLFYRYMWGEWLEDFLMDVLLEQVEQDLIYTEGFRAQAINGLFLTDADGSWPPEELFVGLVLLLVLEGYYAGAGDPDAPFPSLKKQF